MRDAPDRATAGLRGGVSARPAADALTLAAPATGTGPLVARETRLTGPPPAYAVG
ncbi:hypothetical protein SHO565_58120 [Streptomyces sp. HO565]